MEEAIGAVLAWALFLGVGYLFKTLHNYNISSIEKKYKIGKKDSVKSGIKKFQDSKIYKEEMYKRELEKKRFREEKYKRG